MRYVDESRTIINLCVSNWKPSWRRTDWRGSTNKPFGVLHLSLPVSISLLLLFSLLSLLCKNNSFFSLTFTFSSNCNYFVSVSVSLCFSLCFFFFFFWVGNGRSDDSRRCGFESQIGAVHDPLQPSSPHRFPLLRSRPVSQALHHLVMLIPSLSLSPNFFLYNYNWVLKKVIEKKKGKLKKKKYPFFYYYCRLLCLCVFMGTFSFAVFAGLSYIFSQYLAFHWIWSL